MFSVEKKPMISVIVPVYKVEQYIHACINSLLDQTYSNIEIILVDDGSPDLCGEICDKYAKLDTRVRVIHKPNGGLSEARNYGLQEARGELLSFIDSDDFIDKHFYEILVNEMIRTKSDIAECYCIKFEDGESPRAIIDGRVKELTSKEWLTESNLGEFISCVVWNKIYKRSLFDGIMFPVGRRYEDEATTYKVVYRANKIVRVNSALYFYRQRKDSITQAKRTMSQINDQFQALEERVKFFQASNEHEIARFFLAKLGIYMISVYGTRKRLTGIYKDWYVYLMNIFKVIVLDFSIPIKYKLYIMLFLLCPFAFYR